MSQGEAPQAYLGASLSPFALSGDGSLFAYPVTVHEKPSVRLWNVDSGQVLRDIPTLSEPTALAFGPSGKGILVMTGDFGFEKPSVGTAHDTATGAVLTSVHGMFGIASHIAFSPDGKRLAIASIIPGTNSGEVKLWDLESQRELMTLKPPEVTARSLHFTPDGHKLIFLGGRTGVHIWDGTPLADWQRLLFQKIAARIATIVAMIMSFRSRRRTNGFPRHRLKLGKDCRQFRPIDARSDRGQRID